MYFLLIILLILVEILAASWIIFFLRKTDKAILEANNKVTEFKQTMVPLLTELRLQSRLLYKKVDVIKHNQKVEQIKNLLTTIANYSFILYFMKKKK